MTYENLQGNFDDYFECHMTFSIWFIVAVFAGAMESVNNTITEMEARRGKTAEETTSSITGDGLTGFTATLLDAVTRLTLYVNEVNGDMFQS